MDGDSAEVKKAARALLFFCENIEPRDQWQKAVDIFRAMNHMDKARVWHIMANPAGEIINEAKLSIRRTAYKRALREVEEGGGICVESNRLGVMPHDDVERDHLVELLQSWVHSYARGDSVSDMKFERGDSVISSGGSDSISLQGIVELLRLQQGSINDLKSAVDKLPVAPLADSGGGSGVVELIAKRLEYDTKQKFEYFSKQMDGKIDGVKTLLQSIQNVMSSDSMNPGQKSVSELTGLIQGWIDQEKKNESTLGEVSVLVKQDMEKTVSEIEKLNKAVEELATMTKKANDSAAVHNASVLAEVSRTVTEMAGRIEGVGELTVKMDGLERTVLKMNSEHSERMGLNDAAISSLRVTVDGMENKLSDNVKASVAAEISTLRADFQILVDAKQSSLSSGFNPAEIIDQIGTIQSDMKVLANKSDILKCLDETRGLSSSILEHITSQQEKKL